MLQITYGSVCSGIEAATCAWHPLGWRAAWLAEIEPFPCAVLAHHYPTVPNLGDMTTIADKITRGEIHAPDILTGGTPCQAFSVAGLRKGLDDQRGQLTIAFFHLADAIDAVRLGRGDSPSIIVWENVPGVLSDKGNAFGCFLAGLAGEDDALQPPGNKWANAGIVYGPTRTVAWRVLDAQYFGVAQRRRRVWVVASSRQGFDPAAVLFEFDGVRRDTAPSREAGEGTAHDVAPCLDRSGTGFSRTGDIRGQDPVVACIAHGQGGAEIRTDGGAPCLTCNHEAPICVTGDGTHALKAEGADGSEDGTGRGTPIIAFPAEMSGTQVAAAQDLSPSLSVTHTTAVAFSCKDHGQDCGEDISPTLRAMGGNLPNGGGQVAVTVSLRGREGGATAELGDEVGNCLRASSGGGDKPHVLTAMQVRRLTPEECEKLQGFPVGYTRIPWRKKPANDCPDGPRYKALGNSWAVPCAAWIGRRIHFAISAPANDNHKPAANDNRPQPKP